MRRKRRSGVLWVIGGLALGTGIAFLVGVLLFWVWPAYEKTKSPLGEVVSGPIVLRYLKESPVASEARNLAAEVKKEWERVTNLLGIPPEAMPPRIYVYMAASKGELPALFAVRRSEEFTHYAEVDLLAHQPLAGDLGRLACSLAYGGPGNPFFSRGLVLYLNDPTRKWAAEAVVYGTAAAWRTFFKDADQLLPADPWEDLFYSVDAPWASSAPSLEVLKRVQAAATAEAAKAAGWKSLAAAFSAFVLERYGSRGVKSFWLASGWERGARTLGIPEDDFVQAWQAYLEEARRDALSDPILAAKGALHSGHPSQALEYLATVAGKEAKLLRGQAFLALGEPAQAYKFIPDPALSQLLSASRWEGGRLVVIAKEGDWQAQLAAGQAALNRALSFWGLKEDQLPQKIVIYVSKAVPATDPPWGVIWVSPEEADLATLTAKFVLQASSPALGLPHFRTLTEGLILVLAHPERDFRKEAANVVQQGKWVSLGQPLFDPYPKEIAQAEAGAFVEFLLEKYGKEGVKSLWQALLEGLSPYSAVQKALGAELDELDQALRLWVTAAAG